jgi:hypothetical protein
MLSVIFRNTLHHAPEAAAVDSSSQHYQNTSYSIFLSVSVSFVIEVIISKAKRVSEISADDQ